MEDASLIALLWSADDELDMLARYREISDAHAKIGELLKQIDSASRLLVRCKTSALLDTADSLLLSRDRGKRSFVHTSL